MSVGVSLDAVIRAVLLGFAGACLAFGQAPSPVTSQRAVIDQYCVT